MTIVASGILFLTPENKALFLKRGNGSDYPGAWCWPGGTKEPDETIEACAEREAIEELGHLPPGTRTLLTRSLTQTSVPQMIAVDPNGETVDYTTYLQRVDEEFAPEVNGEHTGWAWAGVDEPPEPMHPGCLIALQRLSMDELGVAQAMAANLLTSPQRYQNMWLFDIRITGTGRAYRRSLNEHVWRDPSIYLNDEFLARCNGLSVIWEHPDKATLDSKEFENRVVGSVLLPYIKGDEVWAVAKIYDDAAAASMEKDGLSTSPAVVLKDVDSSKVTLEDGSVLLVEGRPILLDHIAICELGVWDKGDEPTGVRTDSLALARADSERTGRMTEEEEKKAREDAAKRDAEEKARKDADAGEKLDKLLTGLDSMSRRLDAMEMADKARKDAEEKARKDAEEEERKADAKRRDEEHEQWKKEDAAMCAKDDADEEKEAKELEEKGEAREVAADKARKARKDRMDARRKDAEEEERKKKEREDAARKDSATLEDRIQAALRDYTKVDSSEERDAKSDAQARADGVYRELAVPGGAPAPMNGESSLAYRRRLLKGVQKHSADWKDIDLHGLDMATLPIAERRIYADAQVAARDPTELPADRLVQITKTDPTTGLRSFEFRGRNTFIAGLRRPSARVTGMRTESAR